MVAGAAAGPIYQHHRPVTLTESGAESALLQFYHGRTAKPKGRWLRVLAQLYAPQEPAAARDRNVGYVVQCASTAVLMPKACCSAR
ncbi:hypothetical protein M8494_11040 [Serratia ureilytica]